SSRVGETPNGLVNVVNETSEDSGNDSSRGKKQTRDQASVPDAGACPRRTGGRSAGSHPVHGGGCPDPVECRAGRTVADGFRIGRDRRPTGMGGRVSKNEGPEAHESVSDRPAPLVFHRPNRNGRVPPHTDGLRGPLGWLSLPYLRD